jgi:predicted O-linked N-acetylglucosamine transferase (SPINDLY family)
MIATVRDAGASSAIAGYHVADAQQANPEVTPQETESTDVGRLLKEADAIREQGDMAAAVRAYARVTAIAPDSTYSHYWLATCHEQSGNLQLARVHCEAGLAVEPDQIGLLLRLGSIAVASLDHYLALDCYLRAEAIDPEIPQIDSMIADQHCFLGHVAEGAARFDRALAKEPGSIRLQSNRLFVLNYANLLSPEQLFAEHRRWGESHEVELRERWRPHRNARVSDRALRIGYVSGDLRQHAVAFFLEPLLAHHSRSQFEIHCFDTSRYPEDAVTARLRSHGAAWHRVAHLTDDALADAIRVDGIDILVDLSGHSVMNRLLVFARKPAPVQATWLGYLGTTGLSAIDYRITDGYLDPPGMTERLHTETLYRLPYASCFQPATHGPTVGPLPASRNGHITFGSVNQWSKVGDEAKSVWAEILKAVPDSRFVVVARGAQNPLFAREIASCFARHGIDPNKISVRPSTSIEGFLALFQELDITLDPFPYGGGTTTMHSLWMGAPVITLAGRTAFARNSIGPLSEVELTQTVAATRADYVRIAVALASDIDALQAIRGSLRAKLRRARSLDSHGFAAQMEEAYREMWRRYCSGG